MIKIDTERWEGPAFGKECSLHQLAPYIGKMKSTMANYIISKVTNPNDIIYDPFGGCGTVALEGWILKRQVIANDLSPYASTLLKGKMDPILDEVIAYKLIDRLSKQIENQNIDVDLAQIPDWVKNFFHFKTLQEIVLWKNILIKKRQWFLLSCLLGILHHQRPGFLSFPSSHTVPYLRNKKYPKKEYPELYQYRALRPRLESKVSRALKRLPNLDVKMNRLCYKKKAEDLIPDLKPDAIITSPPYMKRLDYARDNRLRLWLLGIDDYKALDDRISPAEDEFLKTIKKCFVTWHQVLKSNGYCVLVLDDSYSRKYGMPLTDALIQIATVEVGGYKYINSVKNPIPGNRRVRRHHKGSKSEIIIILKRT